jgi:hypothetical protein
MELTFSLDPEVARWAFYLLFLTVAGGCSWSLKGKFKRK